MVSLKTFSARITRRGQAVERNATAYVKKAAGLIIEDVVTNTPIDKGTAKSNWQAAVNERAQGIIPAYVPGEHGSTAESNNNITISKAKEAIAKYRHGGTIHLTNNLPYIGILNDGHSDQAPAGFIQLALLRGREYIRRTRAKLTEE